MMMHDLALVAHATAKAACGGPGQGPCHHVTYLEGIVTGLVQGVTELFPISSLGHNVLLPALIGGNWANALNVSAKDSPYLAFIVALHVATALAMIAYFWRDWLRIIRGFFSSIAQRKVETPDQVLAWMIVLATIPVGLAGLVLQKEVTKVFAKPELAATFLAVNGVILLVSERMRRRPGVAGDAGGPGGTRVMAEAAGMARPAYEGPAADWPTGGPYSQQPGQQQWQGPGGSDDDWLRYGQQGNGQQDGQGQYDPWAGRGDGQAWDPWADQAAQQGQPRDPWAGQGQAGSDPWAGRDPWAGQRQAGSDPWAGQGQAGTDPWAGRDPRAGQRQAGSDPWAGQAAAQQAARPDPRPARRHAAGPNGQRRDARPAESGTQTDHAVAADRRLSKMGYGRAVLVGTAQILALMPGISRDGIVTVAGMWRGLRREDAVRFSFLLSAPIILAAGVLKLHDLTGPMGKGSHGPMVVGAVLAGISAFLSVRFLTKYFSEDKSLNPFGIYCLVAGLGALAYLALK